MEIEGTCFGIFYLKLTNIGRNYAAPPYLKSLYPARLKKKGEQL